MQNQPEIPFKQLLDDNKNRVYNTALNFVQNVEDAEDITQEVFIEVHRSLERFNHQSAVSTWIYRITVNKSLDFIRKKNRQKRFGFLTSIFGKEEGELSHDKGHFEHPGVLMENKEKAKILFETIDTLPENQKTAFILFHLEELSQKEIAEIMETTPKAIESLIQRAKAGLRQKLEILYNNRGI